jgi:hypothetical protein
MSQNKIKIKSGVLLLTILLTGFLSPAHAQVKLEYHENMQMEGLRFWYADGSKLSHIFNRNIAVHGDCFTVKNGYAFFAWYKGGMENRDLMLSRKKLGTDSWVTIQFPNKNTLYSGIYNGVDRTGAGDSHKTTAVGICPIDGTVHLAYDMHVHPLKYRVSKKNIAFAPDAEFTLENFSNQQDYFKEGSPIPNFTYPSFVNNDAGELIVEYRLGTSRQGDKYITYYDGETWSDLILLVKGDNENPQFNQYGGLSYQFGTMYLSCAIRQYESPITYNQGFYFAEAGQRGNEDWKNLNGESFQLPIRGLNRFNNFKVCEPLPPGNDGMTSSPELVVSKNGAIHMVNRVPNVGFVHYHTSVGSKVMAKASSSPSSLSFGGNDGRIYSVEISNGIIRVKSSPEGESNWRTDYLWAGKERFGLLKSVYQNGKIYIVASEDVDTDRIPLHYIVLDIVNDEPNLPEGFTYSCDENQLVTVNATMDIAYGADGKFNYLYNVSSNLTCSDENFGDPNPGADKKCYIRVKIPYTNFISAPADSVLTTGYSDFSVSVNAVDSGGTIKHVALYLDDSLIRTDSIAPYVWGNQSVDYPAELLGITCGKHTLKAVTTDNDDFISTDQFTFYVSGDDCFPQLSLVSPQGDISVSLGDALYVNAQVINNAGTVDKVALFVNEQLIREDTTEPYEWGDSNHPDEIKLQAGTYTLKLSATNSVGFSSEKIFELIVEPLILQVPGKIEAELYSSMKGAQTEETDDTGGGLNVSGIKSGDWLSYEVEIDSAALYQVEYRVASLSNPVKFYVRLDGVEIDKVDTPATGAWQNWKSVVQYVYLFAGRHTIRLDALGSWNINWLDFRLSPSVGVTSERVEGISVYPNPATNELFVNMGNLKGNTSISIFNNMGKLMLQKTTFEQINRIDLQDFSSGIYIISVLTDNQTHYTKFIKE